MSSLLCLNGILILCWVYLQGRLQSQDFGKHLLGVEDLLQIHALVEADITVQAERVKAISAAAQRFAAPGEGNGLGLRMEQNSQNGGWNGKSTVRDPRWKYPLFPHCLDLSSLL